MAAKSLYDNRVPDTPNTGELAGTTLPLLSTVLAGFAIAIMGQIPASVAAILTDPASQAMKDRILENGARYVALPLAISVAIFLTSAVCAVHSQAYSYRFLLELPRDMQMFFLAIDRDTNQGEEFFRNVLIRWRKQQDYWYKIAVWVFYFGVVLFSIGIAGFLWIFVATWVALVFAAVSVLCIVALLVIAVK